MISTPESCTFLSVPVRISGEFSAVTGGGAVLLAPFKSSAGAGTARSARNAAASSARRGSRVICRLRSGVSRCGRLVDDLVIGGAEIALELGDRRGGERVADHVGRAAAHIEELVDADDQEKPRL